MRALIAAIFLVSISSCSTNPGVVQVGPNSYLASVTGAAGAFASPSAMKAKAIRQASQFAQENGGIASETRSTFNRPAVGFPTYDHYFSVARP